MSDRTLHQHSNDLQNVIENGDREQVERELLDHPDLALIDREQRKDWLEKLLGQGVTDGLQRLADSFTNHKPQHRHSGWMVQNIEQWIQQGKPGAITDAFAVGLNDWLPLLSKEALSADHEYVDSDDSETIPDDFTDVESVTVPARNGDAAIKRTDSAGILEYYRLQYGHAIRFGYDDVAYLLHEHLREDLKRHSIHFKGAPGETGAARDFRSVYEDAIDSNESEAQVWRLLDDGAPLSSSAAGRAFRRAGPSVFKPLIEQQGGLPVLDYLLDAASSGNVEALHYLANKPEFDWERLTRSPDEIDEPDAHITTADGRIKPIEQTMVIKSIIGSDDPGALRYFLPYVDEKGYDAAFRALAETGYFNTAQKEQSEILLRVGRQRGWLLEDRVRAVAQGMTAGNFKLDPDYLRAFLGEYDLDLFEEGLTVSSENLTPGYLEALYGHHDESNPSINNMLITKALNNDAIPAVRFMLNRELPLDDPGVVIRKLLSKFEFELARTACRTYAPLRSNAPFHVIIDSNWVLFDDTDNRDELYAMLDELFQYEVYPDDRQRLFDHLREVFNCNDLPGDVIRSVVSRLSVESLLPPTDWLDGIESRKPEFYDLLIEALPRRALQGAQILRDASDRE